MWRGKQKLETQYYLLGFPEEAMERMQEKKQNIKSEERLPVLQEDLKL